MTLKTITCLEKKGDSVGFHYAIYDSFGERLKKYADINGYVPEPGDAFENFSYLNGRFRNTDMSCNTFLWRMHTTKALCATLRVQHEMETWWKKVKEAPALRD